jgi:Fe-S cluster assembly ATPase SufC
MEPDLNVMDEADSGLWQYGYILTTSLDEMPAGWRDD